MRQYEAQLGPPGQKQHVVQQCQVRVHVCLYVCVCMHFCMHCDSPVTKLHVCAATAAEPHVCLAPGFAVQVAPGAPA
jgi:hypothetical protein